MSHVPSKYTERRNEYINSPDFFNRMIRLRNFYSRCLIHQQNMNYLKNEWFYEVFPEHMLNTRGIKDKSKIISIERSPYYEKFIIILTEFQKELSQEVAEDFWLNAFKEKLLKIAEFIDKTVDKVRKLVNK